MSSAWNSAKKDNWEKRLGTSEDTRDSPPPKEKQTPTHNQKMWRRESASAHVLIGEIMVCNRDLQKIKEDINDIEKRLKNIIDVLSQIKKTPKVLIFLIFFSNFLSILKAKF
ncbi:hypothetical protein AB205_0203420 [Aquarana catesbeiana]|uniref:Uncharacterized protein n=1 Tax=Aquarana catesbeiana TaxID=8400 RepID=A0A2G9RMV7_AQUCT|nr:hypothetical protein AB205_0203420 [Aquarana catesbeiana]